MIRGLVINRFTRDGIQTWSSNLSIAGNRIGTDVTGMVGLGNGAVGLRMTSSDSVIGGSSPADRNLISGNGQNGIQLANGSSRNTIQGNSIGVAVDGTSALGNAGAGIKLGLGNPMDNLIGGTAAGEANIIAFNTGNGVQTEATGDRNAFLGNAIFANGSLGIDLQNDGLTANDLDDIDTGGNAR